MSSTSRRRVVHMTTVHHPSDPRIFHKQLASLRDAGFDAHLIAPHEHDEQVQGISIHALPRPKTRRRRLALQPQVFKRASRRRRVLGRGRA